MHDAPSLREARARCASSCRRSASSCQARHALQPAHFNRILREAKDAESPSLVNEVVLRSQARPIYSPDNIGHFGLNLRRYAHFTSPIRRYADLIVHRALIRALGLGAGRPDRTRRRELDEIAEQISDAERRAMAAERETVDRLVAVHLADRVGASSTGRISGVTRSGLFVRLAETGADGFIPAVDDRARLLSLFDETQHALIGERTGESYRLGDTVEVRLVEANPAAGALRFALVSEGRYDLKLARGRRQRPKEQSRGPFRGRRR